MVPPARKARRTTEPELLPRLGINNDRHRPIVDKAHLHVRPEFASLNRLAQVLRQPGNGLLIERRRDSATPTGYKKAGFPFGCWRTG